MLNPAIDSTTLITAIGVSVILVTLIFALVDAKEFL